MNHKAIDAGASAYVKIDVPSSWANASDDTTEVASTGAEKLVRMVDTVMKPVGKMDGDSLNVTRETIEDVFNRFLKKYKKVRVIPQVHKFIEVR